MKKKNENSATEIFFLQFFIELGVGAGGIEDFPDFPTVSKPWKNDENKVIFTFYYINVDTLKADNLNSSFF